MVPLSGIGLSSIYRVFDVNVALCTTTAARRPLSGWWRMVSLLLLMSFYMYLNIGQILRPFAHKKNGCHGQIWASHDAQIERFCAGGVVLYLCFRYTSAVYGTYTSGSGRTSVPS